MNRAINKRRDKPNAGFTLVELIVVILILSLLAGMALPRVSNMIRRQKLDTASRRIAADIRLARSQAIEEQKNITVRFMTSSQQYSLIGSTTLRNKSAGYIVELNRSPYEGVKITNASFNSSADLVFNRLGIPTAGGTVTLSDRKEQATITVSATTGRVTRSIVRISAIPSS